MIKKIVGLSLAAALFGTALPASATEATSDGFPPAQNLDYYHVPGPDMAADGSAAPLGGTDFLFVAGSAFTPRDSSQTVTYPGGGCLNASSGYVVTSLELPDGAVVSGVRLYYYNNGSAGGVTAALTAYDGLGGTDDLIFETSTLNTGYTSEYFTPTSALVIDNGSQSYALLGATGTGLRLCGMRVFYSP